MLTLLAGLLLAAPTAAQPSAFRIGSTFNDIGYGMAVDQNGFTVVTGRFAETVDADPGPGTTSLTSAGGDDVFLARYSPYNTLVSAIRIGGMGTDSGEDVAVDASGNAVMTGTFSSFGGAVDFDPGPGTANLRSAGGDDVFVARYTPAGALISAIRFGGTSTDNGQGVAVDASGNAVVIGSFTGTVDFDPGPATMNLTSAGGRDVFVARYTPAGELVSAIRFGGSNTDIGYSVAVDASGNAVVSGSFTGTVDFDPGPGTTNLTNAGQSENSDVFVARYTASGALVSAIRFGGARFDYGNGLAVDASDNAVVTGYFQATADFDPGPGILNLTSTEGDNVFVARYTPAGALVAAISIGATRPIITSSARGYGVAVDGSDNAVVIGIFAGTADFDPGPRTVNLTSEGVGYHDVFVARYTLAGALVSALRIGGTDAEFGSGVAVDGSGNAVVTGYFSETVDFDPGPGTANLTSSGGADVFVARYTPSGALALVPTSAADVPEAVGVHVSEIAPNPSRGAARLTVTVDRAQQVVVSVYDMLGRCVGVPFAGIVSPGAPEAVEVPGLLPGAYVVHVAGDTFRATRRLVYVR